MNAIWGGGGIEIQISTYTKFRLKQSFTLNKNYSLSPQKKKCNNTRSSNYKASYSTPHSSLLSMKISGHVLYTAQPTPPTHLPYTYIHVHKWFAYELVMTLIKEKITTKTFSRDNT